jgi:CheY-like chemotaxis protein
MSLENLNPSGENELRILVAEDNFVNRTLLKKIFDRIGLSVDMAEDGNEALKAFDNQFYDLVLMDIEMPEKNGFEVTHILREKYKNDSRQPYIIALTANSLSGERERCLEHGMDDYLPKPFTVEDVASLIGKATSHKAN